MRQSPKHCRFWHHQFWQKLLPLLPGLCAAIGVMGLLKLGVWHPLEDIAYTALFQMRGAISWDDRVVIVAIDEDSLKQIGRFPWSRKRYTQLINRLTPDNPSTIVFNLLLSEPSPDDAELASAMNQQGRVILAEAWDRQGKSLPPDPVLKQAAVTVGHIYQLQDSDGLSRQIAVQVKGVPALSLAAAQVYSLVQEPVSLPEKKESLWINWLGSAVQIPTYSYVDVINGRVPAQTFQNKIVVVGVTAAGLDPLQTPYDRNPPATSVSLHATAINNLLQNNFLRIPSQQWVLSSLLIAGCGLSYAMTRRQGRWLGLLGLGLGWGLLGLLLFRLGYWIPMVAPLVLFTTTTTAVCLAERCQENALLRQEITRLWQTYRQDLVTRAIDLSRLSSVFRTKPISPLSIQTSQIAQLSVLAEQFGRSHSTQAAIARSLSIGLVAADFDGFVWFCNPVATAQLQVHLGDVLSACLIPLWLTREQWDTCQETLQHQKPVDPKEIQRGDRWYELKIEPLIYRHYPNYSNYHHLNLPNPNPYQQPKGLLVVLEDITSKKQIEVHLRQQMQGLAEINQLKDDFLNTVSHELRAPISNIKMMIQMLQLVSSEEQREHYLQILEKECDREAELINDLLDLQRLENRQELSTQETIDLQNWLPYLIEPFYERTRARQQVLQLHCNSPLPTFKADRTGLERILFELINNACKYTPPGEQITVEVQATASHVNFSVSNSGNEIPAPELPRIFEKFYRVPNGDRWGQGGTGLGLALVKKLVELSNGTIKVSSQAGQTRFTVQMPLNE